MGMFDESGDGDGDDEQEPEAEPEFKFHDASVPRVPSAHERARTRDPGESKDAAESVDASTLAFLALGVHYRNPDGLTHDEIGHELIEGGNESRRRRGSDLFAMRLIEPKLDEKGEPIRRRTKSTGGWAGVYVITEYGRRVWEGGREAWDEAQRLWREREAAKRAARKRSREADAE
jgi:hypothetical protein